MVEAAILPLKLAGAVASRRGTRLVGPVDLTVEGRGITIVFGPNGAGKTSLLRLMHGLEKLRQGRADWAVPPESARRAQAFVFQSPIMMRREVAATIAYPLIIHGVPRRQAMARAREAAVAVGLGHALRRQSTVLSGGERQKLALARALIGKPQVLFLDEPCANLDGRSTREIEEILLRSRDEGTRVVMSTHDMGQARRLADDVLFLHAGRLHDRGTADSFFDSPATAEAAAFMRGDIVE